MQMTVHTLWILRNPRMLYVAHLSAEYVLDQDDLHTMCDVGLFSTLTTEWPAICGQEILEDARLCRAKWIPCGRHRSARVVTGLSEVLR